MRTVTDEANLRRPISRPPIHSTGMDVREGDTARAEESESRAVDLNSPGSSRGKSGEDYGAGNTEDRLLRAREIQRELGVSRATAYRMMRDDARGGWCREDLVALFIDLHRARELERDGVAV